MDKHEVADKTNYVECVCLWQVCCIYNAVLEMLI